MKKKLYVISSEKIFLKDENFFCDNLDMKTTPEGLNRYFDVKIIGKKSNISKAHKIQLKSIRIFSNLFTYILRIISSSNKNNSNFLIISLSPYTFIACILLKILGQKPYVYLRSNGYDEYKIILGPLGTLVYHFMFTVTSKISNLISCRKYILMNKNGYIVTPSQIDNNWKKNLITADITKKNLIYVGRIRKEKGIYSLIELIKDETDINLTIIGADKSTDKITGKNIKIVDIINNQKELINVYDQNNILILPSFTEGYPMVILEALSRMRPVIIFNEISHVADDRKGIFVAERNRSSLVKTIDHIINNYEQIQKKMASNQIPYNENFINQIKEIIEKNSQ